MIDAGPPTRTRVLATTTLLLAIAAVAGCGASLPANAHCSQTVHHHHTTANGGVHVVPVCAAWECDDGYRRQGESCVPDR